jgi:hypothetical protein
MASEYQYLYRVKLNITLTSMGTPWVVIKLKQCRAPHWHKEFWPSDLDQEITTSVGEELRTQYLLDGSAIVDRTIALPKITIGRPWP